MPTKKASKKSSASSGGSKSAGKKSAGKQSASKKSGAKKGGSKKTSAATKQIKQTAVKVLAGAAAGAVRAIIPPLEEAAGTGEKTAGIKGEGGKKGGNKGGKSGSKSGK